jgi:hypothetical protein
MHFAALRVRAILDHCHNPPTTSEHDLACTKRPSDSHFGHVAMSIARIRPGRDRHGCVRYLRCPRRSRLTHHQIEQEWDAEFKQEDLNRDGP